MQKSLSTPYGSFTFHLVNTVNSDGKSWMDILKPRQMVLIRMSGGGSETYALTPKPVMLGFIETIDLRRDYGSAPTGVISVMGYDFGKVLVDARFYYYYWNKVRLLTAKSLQYGIKIISKGRTEILTKIILAIDQFFNMEFVSKTAETSSDGKRICFRVKDLLGFNIVGSQGVFSTGNDLMLPEVSFWDALTSFIEAPFYEMFTDLIADSEVIKYVRNGKDSAVSASQWLMGTDSVGTGNINDKVLDTHRFYIICRNTPFISQFGDETDSKQVGNLWKSLPKITIRDIDIITEDLSKSGSEVTNYYNCILEGYEGSGDYATSLFMYDVYNEASIKKYGIRQYGSPSIKFLHGENGNNTLKTDNDTNIAWLINNNKRLHDWNYYSDEYISGVYTLQGNPDIQIGKRLERSENENVTGKVKKTWQYYIESVSHDYVRYEHLYTTVNVTRGFDTLETMVTKEAKVVIKHSIDGFVALKSQTALEMSGLTLAQAMGRTEKKIENVVNEKTKVVTPVVVTVKKGATPVASSENYEEVRPPFREHSWDISPIGDFMFPRASKDINAQLQSYHKGLDFRYIVHNGGAIKDFYATNDYDIPIYSMTKGSVCRIGLQVDVNGEGFGNFVVVQSVLKGIGKIMILYGHLKKPTTLKVGAEVTFNSQLGLMGNTGYATTNPYFHVHIQLATGYAEPSRVNWKRSDIYAKDIKKFLKKESDGSDIDWKSKGIKTK